MMTEVASGHATVKVWSAGPIADYGEMLKDDPDEHIESDTTAADILEQIR